MNKPHDKILILDYNTIRFQSMGFISIMEQNGVDTFRDITYEDKLLNTLNHQDRNTSTLFSDPVSDDHYFKFVKANINKSIIS